MNNIKVNFKCDECGQKGDADFSDVEYESESSEGGMGGKVESWGKYEESCSNCPNDISIEHNITEYPVGNFEDGGVSISGATQI